MNCILRPSFEFHRLLSSLKRFATSEGLKLKMGESEHWLEDMLSTKFNIAPRGFGRTSFRLTEIIQMGRLPVYLYTDIPWVPYGGNVIYFVGIFIDGMLS